MKTKEELNVLKEEVETLSKKLAELTEDELAQVNGGGFVRGFGEDHEVNYGADPKLWGQFILHPTDNEDHELTTDIGV